MNVAVHQNGPLVVVRRYAPCRAGQGRGRRPPRCTGWSQLLPLGGDEIDELDVLCPLQSAEPNPRPPAALWSPSPPVSPGAGRAGRPSSSRRDYEALQQQRTPCGVVVAQQSNAALTQGHQEHCDLVTE